MKDILGIRVIEQDDEIQRADTCDDAGCDCYRPTTEYKARRASILNLKG